MIELYKKLSQHHLVRYLFIGGVSYVFELAVLYAVANGLGFGPTIGVAVSFWIGLVISFILQKTLAFKNKATSKKHLLKQSLVYGTLVAVNYTFTVMFVTLLEPHMGLVISRTLALIITTGWNFILYSKIIFKNTDEE